MTTPVSAATPGEGDEADGDSDREVVAEQPHQPDAANQRERH